MFLWGKTNTPINTVIILDCEVEILSFFYLWTILRMRPLKGIPIKMNLNKFDINDVQLLNKSKLKGRNFQYVHMYICKHACA